MFWSSHYVSYNEGMVHHGSHGCGRGLLPSPCLDVTCQIRKKYGHPLLSIGEALYMTIDDGHNNDDDGSHTEEKVAYVIDTS
jgi:hypothetical protein